MNGGEKGWERAWIAPEKSPPPHEEAADNAQERERKQGYTWHGGAGKAGHQRRAGLSRLSSWASVGWVPRKNW